MIDIKDYGSKISKVISCNLLDDIFYEDMVSQSNVLKSTISKGSTTLNSFDLLTHDIFNLLYKVAITFIDDNYLSIASLQNKPIIEHLYNSTIISKLRNRTKASLPNTAISMKYVLDEIISKLRGSNQSKLLKSEQHKLSSLYKQRNELSKILSNISQYDENHELFQELNNSKFPFCENIQSLLKQILQNDPIAKENYDLIDLLDMILSKSREKISYNNSVDKSEKYDSNIILNKSIYNAINNSKNSFSDNKNYDSESILEAFLDNLDKELKNNLSNDPNSNDINSSDKETNIENDSDNLSEDKLNKDGDIDPDFEEAFENALDYAEQKLVSYKKTKYSIIEKISLSLNRLDFLLESTDEDVDNIIIIESPNNITDNQANQGFMINELNNTILNDSANESRDNNLKLDQGKHLNELVHFIMNSIKSIDSKISFSKNSLKKQLDAINFDKVINDSIENIIDFEKNIKLLNVNKNSISNLVFDEIISLSKYFSNPDMKNFLDKVGRKKEIARKASSKHKKDKMTVSDRILLSDDIDNIIDEELMVLSLDIEAFKNDFYDRYLNNRLLTYEKVRPKERNKGPIILCYDGSGSMDGNKIKETKVHIISFIEVARIQKRKLITIQFASKDEPLIIKELNPNNINITDIYEIMSNFIRGGTNFEKPLERAIDYIKIDRFKHADILFITDGVCSISDNFKNKFVAAKQVMEFKLYTVIMHGNTYSDFGDIGHISDEVMEIRSINLNEWNERISEKIFSI